MTLTPSSFVQRVFEVVSPWDFFAVERHRDPPLSRSYCIADRRSDRDGSALCRHSASIARRVAR
jgi:hypothetical protein